MIKLNHGYNVISDGIQYKLIKEVIATKKETGDKYTTDVVRGYYCRLEDALDGYTRALIIEHVTDKDTTLKEVLKKLDEIKEELKAYRA